MSDPTYVKADIEANPEWDVAFVLSEILNDNTPLGWSKYIGTAKCLLAAFEMKRKPAVGSSSRIIHGAGLQTGSRRD